jgi:hypothetical protein
MAGVEVVPETPVSSTADAFVTPGTQAKDVRPSKKQRKAKGHADEVNGSASGSQSDKQSRQPRWAGCEAIAATAAWFEACERMPESTEKDRCLTASEAYARHARILQGLGKWSAAIDLQHSVKTRSQGEDKQGIMRKAIEMKADAIHVILPIYDKHMATAMATGGLMSNQDILAKIKSSLHEHLFHVSEKHRKLREEKRGMTFESRSYDPLVDVEGWTTPSLECFCHFGPPHLGGKGDAHFLGRGSDAAQAFRGQSTVRSTKRNEGVEQHIPEKSAVNAADVLMSLWSGMQASAATVRAESSSLMTPSPSPLCRRANAADALISLGEGQRGQGSSSSTLDATSSSALTPSPPPMSRKRNPDNQEEESQVPTRHELAVQTREHLRQDREWYAVRAQMLKDAAEHAAQHPRPGDQDLNRRFRDALSEHYKLLLDKDFLSRTPHPQCSELSGHRQCSS